MRKTIYTLNLNGYARAITDLTYPLLRHYAAKIGADFVVIDQRQFPGWPVIYEKLQVASLARQRGDDWAFYLDSDTLVHPETVDFTDFLSRDTVAFNGVDMAAVRWTTDDDFRRDGRYVGACTWCVLASRWTVGDLWHPLEATGATPTARTSGSGQPSRPGPR